MDNETMLTAVKVDLGITTTAYDVRLGQYLDAARAAIEREGIVIDNYSVEDGNMIVMYAAHLWRKRDTQEPMPKMLRWMMNNRLFSQKLQED
ncbi:MAG: hypothetical protein IKE74_04165 [Mogibacterium sp.]|nr:hypothetical protein [Mogibacterium sp.]